jgi:hypothetical protein
MGEKEMTEEKKEKKNTSLKEKPKYPPEASGPGSPLSDATGSPLSDASVKGFYTETESYLDFLSLY